MRLWSLHPRLLDTRGIVAVWREGLLARKGLEGKTRGYRNHPQLSRFRCSPDAVGAVDAYLMHVYREACQRGYGFQVNKIGEPWKGRLDVTTGQLAYEMNWLKNKVASREPDWLRMLQGEPDAHPLFNVVEGDVESWERPTVAIQEKVK